MWGVNYPYKAMIDFVLSTNTDMIQSKGEAALFHKDQPGTMGSMTYLISLNRDMLVAHNEALKTSPALCPL